MHALYLLWWVQEKHVPPAVAGSVLAAGSLVLMLAEVPTGWFADRFGHRASLILGSALQVLGILWCWLGEGVAGLTIASLLLGIADAFRSGADQALGYRSCVALGREDAFQRLEARSNAAELIGMLALLGAGGIVVSIWGFAAGWVAEAALCLAGLVIAIAMREPPPGPDAEDDRPVPSRGRALLSPRIALIIGCSALLCGLTAAATFFAQTAADEGTAGITIAMAAMTLAEALGSMLASSVPNAGPRHQVALAALGTLTWTAALAFPSAFLPAAATLSFLFGLSEPLRDTAIQRAAPDDARARAASIASACATAAEAIALPLAGLWRGRRR